MRPRASSYDRPQGQGPLHRENVVHVTQGEALATGEPGRILTTILGSCIATCLRDRETGIGGMNHFLLPKGDGLGASSRFGANAMELLINNILRLGGHRRRLEAKIFGGANVVMALTDIGARNIEFARDYLEAEGIPIVGGDVGGRWPRRVRYWPETGRAMQILMRDETEHLAQEELRHLSKAKEDSEGNDVELF